MARLEFLPYLMHSSNPGTTRIMDRSSYVPQFLNDVSKSIGGEVEGPETLHRGEYFVERDINIRPGGRLTLEAGAILR